MIASEVNDPAPDWDALTTELHCPLCEYNLRGLDQPRCPECGFAFTWEELRRGQGQTHPYLFEHHPKRNVWSFLKTYCCDCWPKSFWSELNPAYPLRVDRLMIYWAISSLGILAAILTPFLRNLWDAFYDPAVVSISSFYFTFPTTPPPPTFYDKLQYAWNATTDNMSSVLAGAATIFFWPWLTLLCLLIFVRSMRKAKIRKHHLLRVIIYGTDYGLFIFLPLALATQARHFTGLVIVSSACSILTLYRVYYAYSRYLRFHLPFATVLSSQIMVLMVFLIIYLQTYTPW